MCSRLSILLGASLYVFFFFNDTATTEIYTLSLHDALPICFALSEVYQLFFAGFYYRDQSRSDAAQSVHDLSEQSGGGRSEEHTSELQSPCNLVCRLLLVKKKTYHTPTCDTTISRAYLIPTL